MLPLRGRTQVPHAVCVRRGLNKLPCDRLELGRRHAGLLFQPIQQRVSGSVRRRRVDRVLWLVLSVTLKAMGRSFLTSTGHGAEGLLLGVVCHQWLLVFCCLCFSGGSAGHHRSTGSKHPGYSFRKSDGFPLPAPWQCLTLGPGSRAGKLGFRVVPESSAPRGSGTNRPFVCALCQLLFCFSLFKAISRCTTLGAASIDHFPKGTAPATTSPSVTDVTTSRPRAQQYGVIDRTSPQG